MNVDLHDTSNCPVDDSCFVCGDTTELSVITAAVPDFQGITMCLTVCQTCQDDSPVIQRISVHEMFDRIGRHARHLGLLPGGEW